MVYTNPIHADSHTDGSDDIQDATASQKGLATAVQVTKLDGLVPLDTLNNRESLTLAKTIFDLCTAPKLIMVNNGVPGADDALDYSSLGHDGTFEGSMTAEDRVYEGNCFIYNLDQIDDYINFGDSDDFSFNDAGAEPVTWMGTIEIKPNGIDQMIITKCNFTTGSEAREWYLTINADEKLQILQYDESLAIACSRIIDTVLTNGIHLYHITSPGDGGATAMNNIKIYIDGVLVNSTSTNNGSYVAMENTSAPLWVGAVMLTDGIASRFMQGKLGFQAIDASVWSASDIWSLWLEVKSKYGL